MLRAQASAERDRLVLSMSVSTDRSLPSLVAALLFAGLGLVRMGGSEALAAPASRPALALIAAERLDSRVQEHLQTLTRDFPSRLSSSSGLERAAEWARARFESYGLEARLETFAVWGGGFERGRQRARLLGPGGQETELEFISDAFSPGTAGPTRGPCLLYPSHFEELERLRPRLAGAWLVRLPPGQQWELAPELVAAVEDACRTQTPAGWIQPGGADGLLHMGGSLPTPVQDPEAWRARARGLVHLTLTWDSYRALRRALVASDGRTPVELEAEVENRFRAGPVSLVNVVADLRGSELPDEFVLVQAHLDAWDAAQGACDDGVGVATTLEAARLIAASGLAPRRTLRFVLYSGEEQGLLGSRAFVRAHAQELERISVVLNHDGGTRPVIGMLASEAQAAGVEEALAEVLGLDASEPFFVQQVDRLRPGPSDHGSFLEAGVPAFHWVQSRRGYERVHHTQFDRFEAVDPLAQRHSALVITLAAWGFAQREGRIARVASLETLGG